MRLGCDDLQGRHLTGSTTDEGSVTAPLAVHELARSRCRQAQRGVWQDGAPWHLTAGKTKAGDLIDPEIAVSPCQFVTAARIGAVAMGTLLDNPIRNFTLTVVELIGAELYRLLVGR